MFYKTGQFGGSPDSGTPLYINVTASDAAGTFYIGGVATNWTPLQVNTLPGLPDPPGTPPPTNSPTVANPIAAYSTTVASSMSYQVQLRVSNPLNYPVTAAVVQPIPTNAMVLSTDGALQNAGSSIVWTTVMLPFTRMVANFAFSYPTNPGASFTLPAAGLTLQDPASGNVFTAQGNAPQFTALCPVQASGIVPLGASGINTPMELTITNVSLEAQTGSVVIMLANNSGATVYSVTNSFALNAFASTNLTPSLTGTVPPGWYSVTAYFTINGGSVLALSGTYIEQLQLLLTLNVINGIPSITAYGPSGSNCVIQAYNDLRSSPTLIYSTNIPPSGSFRFSDQGVTNFAHRSYRGTLP